MTQRDLNVYEEARRLRREEGLAIPKIAKQLGVAKSSVSLWVRDIQLTDEQEIGFKMNRRKAIVERNKRYKGQVIGNHKMAVKYYEIRKGYQEEGRIKAREKDPLHIAGCMLYWAEGSKSRNGVQLINADPDMLLFFVKFLRGIFHISDQDMHIHVNCYTNNGISLEVIENYWLDLLSLPRSCLRKSTVNVQPSSSKQKGRKLLYGTCKVAVHRTQVVQHIFGAIQEYIGIDKPEWLL